MIIFEVVQLMWPKSASSLSLKFVFIFLIKICYGLDKDPIGPTQLLNATGIEGGIYDRHVLKYQPLVTPRLMFQYLMIIYGIK